MTRLERDRPAALAASKASQAKAKRENAKHTPELLEALQFVMAASGEQLSTAFEQAQAAIAKATGDSE